MASAVAAKDQLFYEPSEISLSAEAIRWSGPLDARAIAGAVRRWGVVVFPGLIQGERLASLNHDFDRLIANRANLGFACDEYDNLVNIRVIRDQLRDCPTTSALFVDPFMSAVADAYFGSGQYRLNGEIFVTALAETNGPQNAPPFALHFDKRQVLKFFVYLSDTDERNGATRVLPGSNLRNRTAREHAMNEVALNAIRNVLPEPQTPSMPVCGPAGTLFIFDTDMCHGASGVQAGQMRRTMRGHTHAHAMLRAMAAH